MHPVHSHTMCTQNSQRATMKRVNLQFENKFKYLEPIKIHSQVQGTLGGM